MKANSIELLIPQITSFMDNLMTSFVFYIAIAAVFNDPAAYQVGVVIAMTNYITYSKGQSVSVKRCNYRLHRFCRVYVLFSEFAFIYSMSSNSYFSLGKLIKPTAVKRISIGTLLTPSIIILCLFILIVC